MAGIDDIYDGVINDVINGVREAFLDENVDVDVLQQLKSLWEGKVKASGAVDLGGPKNLPPPTIRHPPNRQTAGSSSTQQATKPSTSAVSHKAIPQKSQEPPQRQNVILSHQQPVQQGAGSVVGNGSGMQYLQNANTGNLAAQILTNASYQFAPGLRVVQASQNPNIAQYTIMQGLPGGGQNMIMIPTTNSQQLNAANLAQAQTSNPGMRPQQPQIIAMKTEPNVHNNIGQLDGAGAIIDNEVTPSNQKTKSTSIKVKKEKSRKHMNMIPQLDGGPGMSDSSSEDELDEEDDDPLRRYASLEDDKLDDGDVVEEDPLNSNDDQSDDEDLDTLFDAEHVVVCQFEKVHRARSKWKFTLKDGIMHLNGKDYVFQKCSGEAEW